MSMISFEDYLENIPEIHFWGNKWRTGGFQKHHLMTIASVIKEHTKSQKLRIIETGAGNTTITFLFLNPQLIISICPDPNLKERILEYCSNNNT